MVVAEVVPVPIRKINGVLVAVRKPGPMNLCNYMLVIRGTLPMEDAAPASNCHVGACSGDVPHVTVGIMSDAGITTVLSNLRFKT